MSTGRAAGGLIGLSSPKIVPLGIQQQARGSPTASSSRRRGGGRRVVPYEAATAERIRNGAFEFETRMNDVDFVEHLQVRCNSKPGAPCGGLGHHSGLTHYGGRFPERLVAQRAKPKLLLAAARLAPRQPPELRARPRAVCRCIPFTGRTESSRRARRLADGSLTGGRYHDTMGWMLEKELAAVKLQAGMRGRLARRDARGDVRIARPPPQLPGLGRPTAHLADLLSIAVAGMRDLCESNMYVE